jgi:Holliday junction resolvase RusA-like endonuclease
VIHFSTLGVPETQGSKSAVIVGGRARVLEGKGASRQRHKAWREAVAAEARRAAEEHLGDTLITGPLTVELRFGIPKPASAPKRRRTWPIKARSGDIDKLARSVLDSCTGVLFADDSQVTTLVASKDWAERPGVEVTLYPF